MSRIHIFCLVALVPFLVLKKTNAGDEDHVIVKVPSTFKIDSHVESGCKVVGSVVLNSDGIAIDAKIQNRHRTRGYTGLLVVAFYSKDGTLMGKGHKRRGVNARGWESTRKKDISFKITLTPEQVTKVATIRVLVRHDKTERALEELKGYVETLVPLVIGATAGG